MNKFQIGDTIEIEGTEYIIVDKIAPSSEIIAKVMQDVLIIKRPNGQKLYGASVGKFGIPFNVRTANEYHQI